MSAGLPAAVKPSAGLFAAVPFTGPLVPDCSFAVPLCKNAGFAVCSVREDTASEIRPAHMSGTGEPRKAPNINAIRIYASMRQIALSFFVYHFNPQPFTVCCEPGIKKEAYNALINGENILMLRL
jgi:hypothetical protein